MSLPVLPCHFLCAAFPVRRARYLQALVSHLSVIHGTFDDVTIGAPAGSVMATQPKVVTSPLDWIIVQVLGVVAMVNLLKLDTITMTTNVGIVTGVSAKC